MELSFIAPLFAAAGTIPLFTGYALIRWVFASFGFLLSQWLFSFVDVLRFSPAQQTLELTEAIPVINNLTDEQWVELLGLILGLILSLVIYKRMGLIIFLVGFSVPLFFIVSFVPVGSVDVPLWGWALIVIIPSSIVGLFAKKFYKPLAIVGTSLYGSYLLANSLALSDILLDLGLRVNESIKEPGGEVAIQFAESLFAFDPVVLTYQLILLALGIGVQYLITAKD